MLGGAAQFFNEHSNPELDHRVKKGNLLIHSNTLVYIIQYTY